MARQRKHKRYRANRGRFGAFSKVFSVLLVACALIVASVIFFRVNTIEVVGNTRYTEEEIIEASGLKVGDNLATLPKAKLVASILRKLPYVEAVTPQRQLPDTVILRIRERIAAASVDSVEGRWLMTSQGKLLEQTDDTTGVVWVDGVTAQSPYVGDSIRVAEEETSSLSYLLQLLTNLENSTLLDDCVAVDCSRPGYIAVECVLELESGSPTNFHLKFPRGGDYNYYVRLLINSFNDAAMPRTTPGTMDLTITEGQVNFIPD